MKQNDTENYTTQYNSVNVTTKHNKYKPTLIWSDTYDPQSEKEAADRPTCTFRRRFTHRPRGPSQRSLST